jgi:hypothetical protein
MSDIDIDNSTSAALERVRTSAANPLANVLLSWILPCFPWNASMNFSLLVRLLA